MLLNGLLCLGFFLALLLLAGLAFIAVFSSRAEKRERDTLNTGRPMLATVVMANSDLYDPDGPESLPGVVAFAFFAPTPQLVAALKTVAERCYECYEHPNPDQLSPPFRALALRMKDHRYRESRRTLVPPEVTDGLQVFVADVILYRDRFLDGWSEHRIAVCSITGAAEGQIAHLPLEAPGSRQIHQAVGPEVAQLYARTVPADGVYAAGQLSSDAGSHTKARELRFYLVVGSVLLMTAFGCGGCLFTRLLSGDGGDDGGDGGDGNNRRTVANTGGNLTTGVTPTDPRRTDPRSTRPPISARPPISTRPSFTPKVELPKIERPKFEPPKFRPPVTIPNIPSPNPDPSNPNPPNPNPPNPNQPVPDPFQDSAPVMKAGDPRLLPSNMRSAGELNIRVDDPSDVVLGSASCPIAVVGRSVWDLKSGGRRVDLPEKPIRDSLKVLSADGEWLAVASKMPHQPDTAIAVYKTRTGERAMEVPGKAGGFVDFLAFTRDKFLVTGGRHSNEIAIWDASTGSQRPTIQSPSRSIREEQSCISPDGLWYTATLSDSIALVSTKAGGPRVKLQPPSGRLGNSDRKPQIQALIQERLMLATAQTFRFSPDSQELAAVIDSNPLQFVCWNLKGEVVLEVDISAARETFFFRRTLSWFPDKSGWVIAGHFLDREQRRIVTSIPARPVTDPLIIQPLSRTRLLALLPHEPHVLGVYEIEWPRR